METILAYISKHPDNEARLIASQTFSQAVQNNPPI